MINHGFQCGHEVTDGSGAESGPPFVPAGWAVFRYSCPICFNFLWKSSPSSAANILIVWDGDPKNSDSSLPGLLDFITPLDWALAMTLESARRKRIGTETDALPIVAIIDFHSHERPGSFTTAISLALREALPHVKVFSPFDCYGRDFLAQSKFLNLSPMDSIRISRLNFSQLNALRQAWLGYTAKSGDHHDINNIVGVQILHAAYGIKTPEIKTPESVSGAQSALGQVIRWLGFASDITLDAPAQVLKDCDIYLLDDRAEDGWLQVLGLHMEKPSSGLYFSTDPMTLLAEVTDLPGSQSPDWTVFSGDRAVESAHVLSPDRRASILMIDLWLFVSGRQEEDDFFRALSAAILKKYSEDASDKLINSVRADACKVKDALAKGAKIAGQPDYERFLTLLPRFVACLDYKLPIILFSSTGKRSVVDLLRDYRNIITCVPKPQCLAGVSGELTQSFSTSLSRAFEQAMGIIDATKIIRKVEALGGASRASFATVLGPCDGGNGSRHLHVELYLDESGELGNTVGGCYAVFDGKSREEAIAKANDFDDQLVQNGFYFFFRSGIGPELGAASQPLHKRPSNIEVFSKAADACTVKTLQLGFVRLKREAVADKGEHLFSPSYWEVLRDILEVFLYESCSAVMGLSPESKNISLSIYAGTRVVPVADRRFRDLEFAYGVGARGKKEGRPLVAAMHEDGLLPILVDLQRFRKQLPAPFRCIAVRLIYAFPGSEAPPEPPSLRTTCRSCRTAFAAQRDGTLEFPVATFDGIFRRNSIGIEYRLLKPLNHPLTTEPIRVPARLVNVLTDNPNAKFFTYTLSLDSPVATSVTAINPGSIEEQKILQQVLPQIEQWAWQVQVGGGGGCVQCDPRPDYRSLHYAADWALAKPDHPMLQGILNFDDNTDTPTFKSWIQAGRAIDADDRPRALREAMEAMRSRGIPQNSIGEFVVARLEENLKKLERDEFFAFIDSIDKPLDPFRGAPVRGGVTRIAKKLTLSGFQGDITKDRAAWLVGNFLSRHGVSVDNLKLSAGLTVNGKPKVDVEGDRESMLIGIQRLVPTPWRECNIVYE